MSGFENYPQELAGIDREIVRYAALCGIDLNNRYQLQACLAEQGDGGAENKPRESLRGLLLLRMTLEAEMIEQGLPVKPLSAAAKPGSDVPAGS
jgi:hypothetical protein